ncbi:MAG: glycosyltransferase [Lachnospiraceae bacterium]|nr:glycosyltransferase [Lachnospiraceae bacterium]
MTEGKQEKSHNGEADRYCLEVFGQVHPYFPWRMQRMSERAEEAKVLSADRSLFVLSLRDGMRESGFSDINVILRDRPEDYAALTACDGSPAFDLASVARRFVQAHPQGALFYGDEDCVDPAAEVPCEDARFHSPWLKGAYSPQLLLNCMYFGSMVIFRKDLLLRALKKVDGAQAGGAQAEETAGRPEGVGAGSGDAAADPLLRLYELTLEAESLLMAEGKTEEILHIPEVLFHRKAPMGEEADRWMPCSGQESAALRDRILRERGLAAHVEASGERADEAPGAGTSDDGSDHVPGPEAEHPCQVVYDTPGDPLVSVVLLSKDHPEVLEVALKSFTERTAYAHVEFLVADNGSSPENRKAYEALSECYGFRYLVHPSEFNFSAMCNLGYREAKGDLILFLNDDVEILQGDWLRKMAGLALQPGVGAVGARLHYAHSELIQHVGVTMLKNGPSHKLTGFSDRDVIYHGVNRLNREVLSVTAACLLVGRRKLEAAGPASCGSFPFDESLKVAYNDVELCFRLARAGYRNVQCNEALLDHYESLTRGSDAGNAAKWERLYGERKALFALYPEYEGRDPYYHPDLIDNALGYEVNYKFPWTDKEMTAEVLPEDEGIPGKRLNAGPLRARIDEAVYDPAPYPGAPDTCVIRGWVLPLAAMGGKAGKVFGCLFPAGRSEAVLRADRILTLTAADGQKIRAVAVPMYRSDLEAAFSGCPMAGMAGFFLRLPAEALQKGTWRIGITLRAGDAVTGSKDTKAVLSL